MMGRLTLRLPETLHQQIVRSAKAEGVSINQYIVFALTQHITRAYLAQTVDEAQVAEQRAHYGALLSQLGRASFEEIQQALGEREEMAAEPGLTPEVVENLREKIKAKTND